MQSESRSSKAPILAVRTVIPSIIRFLTNKSKEQASFWRKDTKTRSKTAMFTFPVIPVPIKEEWNHVASLRPNILELCTVFARPDVKLGQSKFRRPAVPDFCCIDRDSPITIRRRRRRRRRRVTQPPRRRCHRRRRRRRRQLRLPSTRAFRSQLIPRSWLAARYSPTPCLRSPITDIMPGSRLALHVVASPRHEARPHSQHPRLPSSAFDLFPWNGCLHPSPRYVMNASIQQCMAANS